MLLTKCRKFVVIYIEPRFQFLTPLEYEFSMVGTCWMIQYMTQSSANNRRLKEIELGAR